MARSPKKRGSASSKIGRPTKGNLSSFSPHVVGRIKEIRRDYEELGGNSIRTRLQQDLRYANFPIPSRSAIAQFLQSEGFIKNPSKRRSSKEDVNNLPCPEYAHQRWQIDAKGNEQIQGLGTVGLINIKDVHTCMYVGICPVSYAKSSASPSGDDYRLALRLAFAQVGLPEQIQCDRAGVFYDSQNQTPFPTLFHLWLVGLGIQKVNSRVRTPTDQGAVERQNRTTFAQINRKSGYQSWEELYDHIQQQRDILNYHLPCASLGNKAPLEAFPQAAHSNILYRPEAETKIFDMNKVDKFLSQLSWKRKVSANGTIKISKQVYTVSKRNKGQMVNISFDAFTRHFVFKDRDGLLLATRPVKGIEAKRILGQQPFFLPKGFQLQLPFNPQIEGNLRLNWT